MTDPVPGQTWDPERYRRTAGFVAALGRPVVDLLDPQPGEHILDVGCGDGTLTKELADLGCAVVGVDASAEQVAAARQMGLNAFVRDAADLDYEARFDAVFSNAALHWVKNQDAAIAGMARALKPGGRVVAEMGGAGNVALIGGALRTVLDDRGVDVDAIWPWVFPSVDEQSGRLRRHGFRVEVCELIPRPTPLPGPMADWLDTFAEVFLNAVPESDRIAVKAQVCRILAPQLRDTDGAWTADYVRLRFRAVLAEAGDV